MSLTDRQSQILNTIIEEYIETAMPVSSSIVFDIGRFDVSCPTIRNEMFDLTEKGYLIQPHVSAGRVPTERGYRFFVDNLLKVYSGQKTKKLDRSRSQKVKIVAQEISRKSSDLVIFLEDDGDLQYIGLKKVLNNPEFENKRAVISFIEELEHLEYSTINALDSIINDEIDVFIGSENPLFEKDDYSMVASRLDGGFIALIGPMRMNYRRNLQLL